MTINIKVMFDVHMFINQMIYLLRNKYSNHFIPGRDNDIDERRVRSEHKGKVTEQKGQFILKSKITLKQRYVVRIIIRTAIKREIKEQEYLLLFVL